jgi:hypothetical protein
VNQQTWGFKVLLYFDMFVGACIWRDSDITISSFTGLALRKQTPPVWAVVLGALLNKLQPGHCESAITHDQQRALEALTILGYKP